MLLLTWHKAAYWFCLLMCSIYIYIYEIRYNIYTVFRLITARGLYKILKLWGAALICGPALIRGNTVCITCWMKTILSLKKYMICLKELRNCVFGIICIWSLFCSVRVYISQPFLTIVLVKLSYFCVSVTLVFCF